MPSEIFDVKKTFLANLVSWCVILVTKTLNSEAFPKAELSADIARVSWKPRLDDIGPGEDQVGEK